MKNKNQNIKLKVPGSLNYLHLIRLVASGIGNMLKYSLEEIEDLKLAVSEACATVFSANNSQLRNVELNISILPDRLKIKIIKNYKDFLKNTYNTTIEAKVGLVLIKYLMNKISHKIEKNKIIIHLEKTHSTK